jgi:hypothetical protein
MPLRLVRPQGQRRQRAQFARVVGAAVAVRVQQRLDALGRNSRCSRSLPCSRPRSQPWLSRRNHSPTGTVNICFLRKASSGPISGTTACLYQCFLSPSGDSLVLPRERKANSIIRQSRKGVRASIDTAMPMRSGLTRLLPDSSSCMSRYSAWLTRSKCAASSNQGWAAAAKLSMPCSAAPRGRLVQGQLAGGENSEMESK